MNPCSGDPDGQDLETEEKVGDRPEKVPHSKSLRQ